MDCAPVFNKCYVGIGVGCLIRKKWFQYFPEIPIVSHFRRVKFLVKSRSAS